MNVQAEKSRKYRLAILARHVIQYHSPLYREIARSPRIEATVLFMDRGGLEPVFDPTMNATIEWDVPLLEGFSHAFLQNWSPRKTAFMLGRINPGLVWRLRRANFDGVLIQGYDTLSSMLALWTAKLRGLQVIFRGEAVLREEPRPSKRQTLKDRIVRAFVRRSDAVLYTCGGNREFFRHYGCPDERLYPFPCAVDNGYFRAQREQLREAGNPLRRELGIAADVPVALMVGRIDGRKRQEDLVRAAASAQERGSPLAVVFVGDGPDRARLEALAKTVDLKDAHFPGFQNQSKMSAFYDLADFCCLCSSYDPTPKTVNEALNFALPLIVSDSVGTVGDSLRDGENALVYSCGDVEALAGCLERLSGDGARRREMGARSLELGDVYTLEADVAGLEGAIEDLIVAKNRRK